MEGSLEIANISKLFGQHCQVEIVNEQANIGNNLHLKLEHVLLMVIDIVPLSLELFISWQDIFLHRV